VKAAGKLAEMIGRPLSHEQKKKLGPVVHYSFCTLQSGVYGAVAEWSEGHGFIAGLTFGAALFVAADEVVVPALSLSPKPMESSISSHLYGLAAHLVYGVTTEVYGVGCALPLRCVLADRNLEVLQSLYEAFSHNVLAARMNVLSTDERVSFAKGRAVSGS
jgi:hypothetical protein